MKIAVVGSGIAGMGAALALSEAHEVVLFERAGRFGGHANTVEVERPGGRIAVDTGFIVYNFRNYPNLVALFEHLGVPTRWSDMSFGMSLRDGGLEYACDNLDKIFAQRRNMLSLPFLRLLSDIRRFNDTARGQLERGELDGLSLGDWMARQGYSDWFRHRFLLPMGGAIWSTPVDRMESFPARNFVTFFRNHDLMTGLEPAQRWRTVDGGSREYVSRLIPRIDARQGEVVEVRRGGRPELVFADGSRAQFDQVVLAVHGPDACRLLAGKAEDEAAILGGFRVSRNRALLHSDASLMPKRRKVWSSWNFLCDGDRSRPAPVTYWMNRLQSLPGEDLFVSLNPARTPRHVHAEFDYAHPVFDERAFAAQAAMDGIQGRGGVWYAGAWLGYGFHEDGLRAGLRVADALGARPDWAVDVPPLRTALSRAAE